MTGGDPIEYDLFISYAHRDSQPVPGINNAGWVETLYAYIKNQLGFRLGRDPSLWMDSADLRHGEAVSKQLIDKVQKSRSLLVVLSPSYLQSEWCRRERNEFLKLAKERRDIESIFIVEVDQIDRAEIPVELSDLRTFRFWKSLEGGATRTLGFPHPDKDQDYSDRVVELCFEIARLLQKRPPPPIPHGGPGLTDHTRPHWPEPTAVFLAQVTDDLDTEAASVRSFLEQHGISVLPSAGVVYPPNLAAFQKEAEKDIIASEYFVQLLSEVVGKKPPDIPQGFAAFQCDLAERHGKEIVQWRNPSVRVEDVSNEWHRALLERATVQAGSIELFKPEIIRRIKLNETRQILVKRAAQPDQRDMFLFVNMDDIDCGLANDVCAILKSEGIPFSKRFTSDNPEDNRIDLEDHLRACHGLIVIYGKTSPAWVRRQVLQAQKALAYRETRAMMRGVCVAPPKNNKDLEDPVGMYLDAVLDCMQGVNKTEILKFVERVRESIASSSPVAG